MGNEETNEPAKRRNRKYLAGYKNCSPAPRPKFMVPAGNTPMVDASRYKNPKETSSSRHKKGAAF
jgi:hypothetical protein